MNFTATTDIKADRRTLSRHGALPSCSPIPRHKMQTVKERTRFGLLVAALIFIGIGVGILYGAQRLIADARLVAHSNEVIGRLDELEARLRDAESAQRGYLLTGRVEDRQSTRMNYSH